MALSFEAVKQAFKVMNQLDLQEIRSFPPDFYNHVRNTNKKVQLEIKLMELIKRLMGDGKNYFSLKRILPLNLLQNGKN